MEERRRYHIPTNGRHGETSVLVAKVALSTPRRSDHPTLQGWATGQSALRPARAVARLLFDKLDTLPQLGKVDVECPFGF